MRIGCCLPALLLCLDLHGGVVINELMYHPPEDSDDLQYLELHNPEAVPVDLGGWKLAGGIRFEFPEGASLPPGGYLVVAKDREALRLRYGGGFPSIGDFSGRLSHRGERVELRDSQGDLADAVEYQDRDGWPRAPDGYSASLERIHPGASGLSPSGWEGSGLPEIRAPEGSPGERNRSHSPLPPPRLVSWSADPPWPRPGQQVRIRCRVEHGAGIASVTVRYRHAFPGREAGAGTLELAESGGEYSGLIPAPPSEGLLRFAIEAEGEDGALRRFPSEGEPRPAFSVFAAGPPGEEGPLSRGVLINPREVEPPPEHYRVQTGPPRPEPARGGSAWIHYPLEGAEPELFDFIRVTRRNGGVKLRFHSDRPWQGMTVANLLAEDGGLARSRFSPRRNAEQDWIGRFLRGRPRMALAEHLSYELYRRVGVGAPPSGFLDLAIDGRPTGPQLVVGQINGAFLGSQELDGDGSLYKLQWFGRGLVEKHEKKNNRHLGHEDLLEAYSGLRSRRGDGLWEFIASEFDADHFAAYYAVCLCISNWDGYFNNHYLYHDTGGDGRWKVYPWDNDKTWGYYDGISPGFVWHTFPLTSGMDGDAPPSAPFGGIFGGRGRRSSWWRPPGEFSGPMLANPSFRRLMLGKLKEICRDHFTEEAMFPEIERLRERLLPGILERARLAGMPEEMAGQSLEAEFERLRDYLVRRREFILGQLAD